MMAAGRELANDIFRDSDGEEFVEFSREELGIHSDGEVKKHNEDDDNEDETGREIHDEYSTLFSGKSWAYKYPK